MYDVKNTVCLHYRLEFTKTAQSCCGTSLGDRAPSGAGERGPVAPALATGLSVSNLLKMNVENRFVFSLFLSASALQ